MSNRTRLLDPAAKGGPRLRARLHDPSGPFLARAVLPGIALIAIATNAWWWREDGGPPGIGLFVGLALLTVASLLRGRNRPQNVDLVPADGAVHVANAGVLRQVIRARRIRAASTARTARGACLALVRSDRASPLLVELQSDADVIAICDALGIGHAGFGEITWEHTRAPRELIVSQIALALLWLASGAALASSFDVEGHIAVATLVLTVFYLVAQRIRERKTLTLSPAGLCVRAEWRRDVYPYHQIRDVRARDDGIEMTLESGAVRFVPVDVTSHFTGGLTAAELALVADQVRSASLRAHGHGPSRDGAAARVDVLRRRDEPASAWLGRLDTLAATLTHEAAGYRQAVPARDDLWGALRDPEADIEVRAAAARVLVRVDGDDARKRVRAVAASVRVASDADHILAALDPDTEVAATKLRRR